MHCSPSRGESISTSGVILARFCLGASHRSGMIQGSQLQREARSRAEQSEVHE